MDKKEQIIEKIRLDELRKKELIEIDVKILAGKLIEELEAGKFTIQELAEFAAYNAVRVEANAEKSNSEFGTWYAIKNGGVKALPKLNKPNKYIFNIYTRNGKLHKGGKVKSENDPRSIAIREIVDGWENLKASYEGGKIPRGTKQKYLKEKIEVTYKPLQLDQKNIENRLKYKK